MKVFLAIFQDDAHQSRNPYVATLIDMMSAIHPDIECCTIREKFWTQDDWDIVHVMWPDSFAQQIREGRDLQGRIRDLKKKGAVILATVHNIASHWKDNSRIKAYNIVYPEVDVFIHLWSYSKVLFEQKYPFAKSVVIPHHVYDTLYEHTMPTKQEALEHFHLTKGVYVLVFGETRNLQEKKFILDIISACPDLKFVVPNFIDIPHGKFNKRWIKQRIKRVYYNLRYRNLLFSGKKYVPEEELPMYYALSDISLIQRLEILNSGNVPMGMLFGHVIVGPNVGNVGALLQDTGNFCFNPNVLDSVRHAIYDAKEALQQNLGSQNREFAINNWSTRHIVDDLYNIYMSCMK